ncbi:hypothetical protein Emag_004348 [Eimeria magna]
MAEATQQQQLRELLQAALEPSTAKAASEQLRQLLQQQQQQPEQQRAVYLLLAEECLRGEKEELRQLAAVELLLLCGKPQSWLPLAAPAASPRASAAAAAAAAYVESGDGAEHFFEELLQVFQHATAAAASLDSRDFLVVSGELLRV